MPSDLLHEWSFWMCLSYGCTHAGRLIRRAMAKNGDRWWGFLGLGLSVLNLMVCFLAVTTGAVGLGMMIWRLW